MNIEGEGEEERVRNLLLASRNLLSVPDPALIMSWRRMEVGWGERREVG